MNARKRLFSIVVAHFIRINEADTYVSDTSRHKISKTCYDYLNDTIQWTLQGEELHNFIHAAPGKSFSSPLIPYHEMKFRVKVYPNGVSRAKQGFGCISLYLKNIPSDIIDVGVLCTVYIDDKCVIQDSLSMDKDFHNARLTPKKLPSFHVSEYMHSQKMTFSARVTVLDYSCDWHKEDDERPDVGMWQDYNKRYLIKYKVPEELRYKWTFDETILRTMRHSKSKVLFMDSPYNHFWTVSVQYDGHTIALVLRMLLYPIYATCTVESVDIRIKITLKYSPFKGEMVQVRDLMDLRQYGRNDLYCGLGSNWWKQKSWVTSISMKVEISLLRVFDDTGELVYENPDLHKKLRGKDPTALKVLPS